jgi:Flp pilus assembly protein TadD
MIYPRFHLTRIFRLILFVALAVCAIPVYRVQATDSSSSAANRSAAAGVTDDSVSPEELGDAFMLHQRYQAAIEAYKKAPVKSASLWNKLGIAYQMMYDYQDAVRCYKVSLKLNSKNSSVYNNLGTIYDSLKQLKNAERMYRKSLKYQPKSALVLKNLGTNLLAQHKYKKGWEYYQAAQAIDPNIFERTTVLRSDSPSSVADRGAMNYFLAKGCVRAGNYEKAIDYLRNSMIQGFTNPKMIAADKEFAILRGMPAFEQLIANQKNPE